MITDHVAAAQEALRAAASREGNRPATALAGYLVPLARNASARPADAIGGPRIATALRSRR